MGIKGRMMLMLGPFIVLVFMALTFVSQWGTQTIARQNAETEAFRMALEQAPQVLGVINKAAADTDTFGKLLVSLHAGGTRDRTIMGGLLRDFLGGNKEYQGVWVVWEPNAFDGRDADFLGHEYSGEDGSLAMYWYLGESGSIEVTGVNVRSESFYTIPKASGKLTLIEPYIDPAAQPPVLMTTITLPLVENGKVLGVFGIDIALGKLSELIAKVTPYGTGYANLFSNTGTIVASGDPVAGKGLDALPAENTAAIREAVTQGKPYHGQIAWGGHEYLATFTPITVTEGSPAWSLEVAVPLDRAMAEADRSLWRTIVISAVGIAVLIAGLLFAAASLSSPLRRVAAYAAAVAGGDYEAALDKRGFKGELVVLGQALSTMVANLIAKMKEAESHKQAAERETAIAREATCQAEEARKQSEQARREGMLQAAAQLEDIVSGISGASADLSERVRQAENGAAQQAARAAETATAMEEMNSTVLEVAHNAASASEASTGTRTKAADGAAVVHRAVDSIQTVQKKSLELKGDMSALTRHAESINQIMNVISDIADQTNLLALNAAIEAARAGDAGRSFAVVADEVRNLAEKTMTSTTDVGNAIKAIQNTAATSRTQVDSAVAAIEEATLYVNQSGEALTEIVGMVDNTADQVHAIATASEQQSATSEEINRSISHVNAIAGETAQAMREAADAVSDLSGQAQALTALIEQMKKS